MKTDRVTYVLGQPNDLEYLSEKQCYVRTRLCEVFIATKQDVETPTRGRRANFVGQLGLRCVFCVPAMNSKDRIERAITYPTTTAKFYQTAQDMQHFHYMSCPALPKDVREMYENLPGTMNNRRGKGKMSPKEWWAKCCNEVGIVDHIGDDGNNDGVKLGPNHSLVERSQLLTGYADELFMPPKKDGEGEKMDGDGEMAQVLAKEVNKSGGEDDFEDLVDELEDNAIKEGGESC